MARFPNFQNETTFPPFAALPIASPGSEPNPRHFLLATISENMTFTDTPTFICKDRADTAFAMKIHITPGFDVKTLKKGTTVVIKGAEREGVVGDKQGFVGVLGSELVKIPSPLGNLIFMSGNPLIIARSKGSDDEIVYCDGCGEEKKRPDLAKCKGCEEVWYCDKNCQKKGWGDGGHKGDCKILKALANMDLGDRGWTS